MNHLINKLMDGQHARAVAAGCVALALGGVVLLRAPRSSTATPRTDPGRTVDVRPGVAPRVEFRGPGVHGRLALSQGRVLRQAGQTVYAEIRVAADEAPNLPPRPVAFAMVLDISGSMSGEKLAQARQSVLDVVDRMRDNDQVALVTYSDSARVIQPMARVGDVRSRLHMVVPTIAVEGGTNIPAGLTLGAQVLSDAPESHVHRVVLMSDGRDGSGQSIDVISSELRRRADHGITLSSLGIGADYDESFMSRLADAGRGNYEFLRDGQQLRTFLARELEQSGRTTVDLAQVEVTLPAGWSLDRAYGVEAETQGRTVRLPVGALSQGEERRMVLSLTVDGLAGNGEPTLGALASRVSWRQIATGAMSSETPTALPLTVGTSVAECEASRNNTVFAEAESTALSARQAEAVIAWREGRGAEAERIASANVARLQQLQAAAPSPALAAQIRQYNRDQGAFNSMSGASEAGRAYGLGANALHRRATRSSAAY